MTHPSAASRPGPTGRGRTPDRVPPRRKWACAFALAIAVGLVGFSAGRAERFPEDPVEAFKNALKGEDAKSPFYKDSLKDDPKAFKAAIAYRKATLEAAAKKLHNLADLGRALLLVEWPGALRKDKEKRIVSDYAYDIKAREVEREVRAEMTKRLREGIERGLKSGNPAEQIALSNLVAESATAPPESASGGILSLEPTLVKLVPLLVKLLETTNDDSVRIAAARALGQFSREPKEVTPALEKIFGPSSGASVAARRAAADALVSLVQSVTGEENIRGSEPGVALRETRRGSGSVEVDPLKFVVNLVPVAAAVTPVAMVGARDPSPLVRRASFSAVRQAVNALVFSVRLFPQMDAYEVPSRPLDQWSELEKKRAIEARQRILSDPYKIGPAVKAFSSPALRDGLARGVLDPDPETRLEARRTLDALANLRKALLDYENSVPDVTGKGSAHYRKPAVPGKRAGRKDAALLRTSGTEEVAALPPPLPTPPVLHLPVAQKAPATNLRRQKEGADPLGDLIGAIGEELVLKGVTDPDPKGRRATHEAIEALGPGGARYIPQLVRSLEDRDVFVRWISARALGKLSPRKPDVVVPALIRGLKDDDLDARIAVTRALGAYGPDAKGAVEALARMLEKGDAEYRMVVIKALEGIGTDSVAALPALVRLFDEIDPRLRAEAARLVGRFGPQAKAYLPQLRKLTSDPDSEVRKSAAGAILSIVAE
jgi:HEAT repeat protein